MKFEKIFERSQSSAIRTRRLGKVGLLLAAIWLADLGFRPAVLSYATSFVEQPFQDTVQDASVIVRGKIGKTGADWGFGADGGKRIYTFSDLEVTEVFKGNVPAKSIVIRELGGEKDGIGMHVAGASTFQKGEDVVVLLGEKNREGSYDVRGLMMGKYNLEKNSAGQDVLVGPGIREHNAPGAREEWTLQALRQVIRDQAKGSAAGINAQKSESISPNPVPSASVKPLATRPSNAAPALQNSSAEEPKDSPGSASDGILPRFVLLWIGLGVLAAWVLLRRRR